MRASPFLWPLVLFLPRLVAAETLTLEDAIRVARSRHPTVMQQRAQLEAARARWTQARSAFLPAITGGLAYNPQTANFVLTPATQLRTGSAALDVNGQMLELNCLNPSSGGPCRQVGAARVSLQPFNYWTASLGLNWTLWDWGRNLYGARASAFQVDAQKLTIAAALLQVTLDVRLAYYNVIASGAFVKVSEDALATLQQHLEQARAFHEAGTRTQIDVASAESDVANAELTLARARGALEAAQALLAAALGDESWHAYTLVTPSEYEPALPATLQGAFDEALGARPEPRSLLLTARSFQNLAQAARGSFLPALVLSAGPEWAGAELGAMTTNFSATLALSFPLAGMNPLFVYGQLREAEANRLVTEEQAAGTRNDIRLETAQAHALLSSARQEVIAAEKLVAVSRQRAQLAEGRYQAGVGSIIELSDAELVYINARYQQVQAVLDLASARARLDHALGRSH